jgi:hypothetical protein
MPIKIDWELKESKKLKKSSYWDITSKHLLVFINTLESINKLIALYRPTPLLILEKGTALKE